MNMPLASARSALSPAVLRVALPRLGSWLPAGPVAVLGDAAPALRCALRSGGVVVQDSVDGRAAAASIVVMEDLGSTPAGEHLQAMLLDIAGPVCVMMVGGAAVAGSRTHLESMFIDAGWRKHPLNERVAPYGELDRINGLVMGAFERVPEQALAVYPLKVLEKERDIHTDMTRESGRRSDAHMTRYAHAAKFIKRGDRVIDVACGFGYGSYQLAHGSFASSLMGLDTSTHAVDYANANFASMSPAPTTFVVGDAQELSSMADGSADFAVAIEALAHLHEPDRLLVELDRVLSPQGRVYASVPNDWSDETGEGAGPFHVHAYDWSKLIAKFNRNGFVIERAWLQDAGGGQKRPLVARSMLEIDPAAGPACDGEWLLVLARKRGARKANEADPLTATRALLAEGRLDEAKQQLEAQFGAGEPLSRARAHALAAIVAGAEGAADVAATHWQHVQTSAREALFMLSTEVHAAGLLHLAAHQLATDNGARPDALQLQLQTHADITSWVLGADATLLDDINDRAVISGIHGGREHISMCAHEVQQLIDAKAWLDGKFQEHMQRIVELEHYTAELEAARLWLDGQYHSLSAELQRLNPVPTPPLDGAA